MKRDPTVENCKFINHHIHCHVLSFYFAADVFTAENKEAFKNPGYYREFRHELETAINVCLPSLFSCAIWLV